MIGYLQGEVVFSDGHETVLLTSSGVGYQVYFHQILAEGTTSNIYVSHIIKEADEELYGFLTLREKKLFELLLTVKGVGPKSAYNLICNISPDKLIEAIALENKASLTKVPGVGPKSAAQLILDLKDKILKMKMYTLDKNNKERLPMPQPELNYSDAPNARVINDAIMACKELGFREDKVMPLIQKVMNENKIQKSEQLVHLVLKEI
jgi:Holliday junction DNA helicase RuvA